MKNSSVQGRHFAPQTPRFKAVSIGGGTGQSHTIQALKQLDFEVSAVVSMVDNGGSTGILRDKAGMVPPGDVRRCLSAMAKYPDQAFARAFEQRFSFADNHSLGNLILTALTKETDSFAEAIDICAGLLNIEGVVLPSSLDLLMLCGKTRDGREFKGEKELGTGPAALQEVWLEPKQPKAYIPALHAIAEADLIVLGPGSLFTSIISNLLVPGVIEAIQTARIQRHALLVFVGPMADMQGETWGLSAEEHIGALRTYGLDSMLDVVLLHKCKQEDAGVATRSFQALTQEQIIHDQALRHRISQEEQDGYRGFIRPVELDYEALKRIEDQVGLVLVRDFSEAKHPTWHAPAKLANALKGVVAQCRLPQK